MKIIGGILATALGILMCLIADYQWQHGWSGGSIEPDSWNVLGSIWIGVGGLFTLLAFFKSD